VNDSPEPLDAAEHARRTVLAEDRCYRVVRCYFNRPGRRRTILHGLTLTEARAHCTDAETSSRTATGATARARTRRNGPWFDAYELDTPSRRR
jgi:hypothetical protein